MKHGSFARQLLDLKKQCLGVPGLPFADVLTPQRIEAALQELGTVYRKRIFTPVVTLWVFLAQVLSSDQSCRAALSRLLAYQAATGQPLCSADTSSYCQARLRLPEELPPRLVEATGADLQQQAPRSWLMQGRCVKIVDGSTVSMPDSQANAAYFGKPGNQRTTVGFPLARLVVVLSLATGAVLGAAMGAYRGKQTGELSLFRSVRDTFAPGDIVLGDRLFCTYADIAYLQQRGVDCVFLLHADRRADFRRGRRLGPHDHVVRWTKPKQRPSWQSAEEFAALPATIELREVRVRLRKKGCRARTLVIVTTLTNAEQFSRADIAELYRQRWHAELDLRSLKTVLQMDVLRGQSPAMVRKEIWLHLLAYNLLRSLMGAAALEQGVPVRKLSFKGALQTFQASYPTLLTASPAEFVEVCAQMLLSVGQHRVGNRPHRYEPRKRKRAAKPYPRLKLPREQERKLCPRKNLN